MATYNYYQLDAFTTLTDQWDSFSRKLDKMIIDSSRVNAIQSPFINCDNAGGYHFTDWGTSNLESSQCVGNFNSQYNNPNSNFYDFGWQDYSDFSWQQDYEQVHCERTEIYSPDFQVQIQPQEEEESSLKEILMQWMARNDTMIQNQQDSIRNLEIQMEQIARAIDNEAITLRGAEELIIPMTENNQTEESQNDEVKVEDEEIDEVKKSVKLEDSVKPTQSQERTIVSTMPFPQKFQQPKLGENFFKPLEVLQVLKSIENPKEEEQCFMVDTRNANEKDTLKEEAPPDPLDIVFLQKIVGNKSNIHDIVEHMISIDTKPRLQLKKRKKFQLYPYERGKRSKAKSKKWMDSKVKDDHMVLCQPRLLLQARNKFSLSKFKSKCWDLLSEPTFSSHHKMEARKSNR